MRLVNTQTLQLEEFFDATAPKYAILSHTWEKEEVLFRDMEDLDKARAKAGFAKLQGACELAAAQEYLYIWIDTCWYEDWILWPSVHSNLNASCKVTLSSSTVSTSPAAPSYPRP